MPPTTNNPAGPAAPTATTTASSGNDLPPAVIDDPLMDPLDEPTDPTMALDECGLDTGFAGDEQCILPPPPGLGFQVHVGPADYDNPDTPYVLLPGEEKTSDFQTISGNDQDEYFYYRQYRMRPTAHHMILSVSNGSGGILDVGRRIGTANSPHDFPAGGVIAPENIGVGSPLAAHSAVTTSLHAINTTSDATQLREIWVNFWYRDAAEVTEPARQVFQVGSASFSVPPHSETTLGPYTCETDDEGRMLWLYGHRHANNDSFSVWRVRGAQRDLIYQGYDWEEPLMLEYNSQVENPVADPTRRIEGGWSGVLDLLPGDRLEWECHVVNEHDTALRFTNQTYLGEMCIVDGEMAGPNCRGGGFF
jgi:hypothetical protein